MNIHKTGVVVVVDNVVAVVTVVVVVVGVVPERTRIYISDHYPILL